MNQFKNEYYQEVLRYVRARDIQGGGKWPERPADEQAVTLYPNILAEIAARSGYLWPSASRAGVSTEVMAAVLEDEEPLTVRELYGLCRFYGRETGYLRAQSIQVVDPATNKGKYRLWQLSTLLDWGKRLDLDAPDAFELQRAEQTRDALKRGCVITYAEWAVRCQFIKGELAGGTWERLRSTRIKSYVTGEATS